MRRSLALVVASLAACDSATVDPCEGGEPGLICAVAGNGNQGFNGDGLPATETDLYAVTQVRRGPDGRVWLMDFNNHRLRVIEDDGVITTVAGLGWHAGAEMDVPAAETTLADPIDFDFLPSGEVVFVSAHDPRVMRIDRDGILRLVAGTGFEGDSGDDGPAVDAAFTELTSIAVAADGTIYVADASTSRVRGIRAGRVFAVAGSGVAGYAGDGGPALAAEFAAPSALAVAGDGALIIADRLNHAVRRISPEGTIETLAGTGVAGFAGDGGPALDATLNQPSGVAVGAGAVFIADRENFRIRRIAADGSISTIAGSGQRGFMGDGGIALDAEISITARLSWSPGELFVADQGNSCARVVFVDE